MNATYERRITDFYYRDDQGGTCPLTCSAHLHYHIELFYLRAGRTRVWIDSEEYTVEAGDILLAYPNRVHRYEALEPERYHLLIIHPDMLPELSTELTEKVPVSPVIRHADAHPDLIGTLDLLGRMAQTSRLRGPFSDASLRGLLLSFFGQLLPLCELTEAHVEDSHTILSIVNFCAQNFTRDLSLEILEEELHLNRFYLSHLFSGKLNIRFNDYINSLRLNDACRLLRTTNLSVTEISVRSGFNTLRTFNRSFIKQMGQSPTEYRKHCLIGREQPTPRVPFVEDLESPANRSDDRSASTEEKFLTCRENELCP